LPNVHQTKEFVDSTMEDKLKDIIRDVGVESFVEAVCENMSNDTETPL